MLDVLGKFVLNSVIVLFKNVDTVRNRSYVIREISRRLGICMNLTNFINLQKSLYLFEVAT
jgi:hypothetical protein